jgi:hypothetical protein
MPLNDEQMAKANQYFTRNGVVPDCPYCSMHGWEGGEIISATVVDEQGNARPEETATVPMVQFVCNNCGHISLFDARRIGLLSG